MVNRCCSPHGSRLLLIDDGDNSLCEISLVHDAVTYGHNGAFARIGYEQSGNGVYAKHCSHAVISYRPGELRQPSPIQADWKYLDTGCNGEGTQDGSKRMAIGTIPPEEKVKNVGIGQALERLTAFLPVLMLISGQTKRIDGAFEREVEFGVCPDCALPDIGHIA